jgi:hypothetical protein
VTVKNFLEKQLREVGYVDPSPCGIESLGNVHAISGYQDLREMISNTHPDVLFVGSRQPPSS